MKLKTAIFQEMMSRVIKGASNNKLIPLTSLISIKLQDGDLTLTSTDKVNYLYIRRPAVDGDDMSVVVEADTLSKLVSRMSSDEISLELKDSYLEVKGNGTYKIDIPLDENGEAIVYPDPYGELDLQDVEEKKITYNSIKKILYSVKPALLVTQEYPQYTGYYVGESVIATNRELITNYDINLFGTQKLVPPELMNLLEVMTQDTFTVRIKDNVMVFESDDCIVYGQQMEGIEEFNAQTIKQLIDNDMKSMCKISRAELVKVLDRLSLFTSDYEGQTVRITISGNSFEISSPSSSGVETLQIIDSSNCDDTFTSLININYLSNQIKVQSGDTIEMWYSPDSPSIKLVDDNLTQIIALVSDNNVNQ